VSTLVTLTTDFGARDPYVASMKGVLFQACAGIQVIDLSHDISPQDVLEGSLFLAGAIPYFPPGGIHIVVIDPGVGTGRLPIVVSAQGHRFVCPDNGLLTLFLREHEMDEARVISNPDFMREKVSATFHGRDVFAPTAARLAHGVPLEEVGERLESIQMLDVAEPSEESELIRGEVIHVDRFGNAITNIPRSMLGSRRGREVRFGERTIVGIRNTYADVTPEEALALFGSAEYLEVAVNGGNASVALGLTRGDQVDVLL
jgi:S-adenosylmethionine hydrolase